MEDWQKYLESITDTQSFGSWSLLYRFPVNALRVPGHFIDCRKKEPRTRKKRHNETHQRRETFSEIIRTDRLCPEKSPVKNDYTMPAQSLERNHAQYYQI